MTGWVLRWPKLFAGEAVVLGTKATDFDAYVYGHGYALGYGNRHGGGIGYGNFDVGALGNGDGLDAHADGDGGGHGDGQDNGFGDGCIP